MVKIDLHLTTLTVLIAGLYCMYSGTNSMAVPESVYYEIAEKLEPYLEDWDYERISFEDWIRDCLLILPRVMLDDDTVNEMITDGLYWERENGSIILSISMSGLDG